MSKNLQVRYPTTFSGTCMLLSDWNEEERGKVSGGWRDGQGPKR